MLLIGESYSHRTTSASRVKFVVRGVAELKYDLVSDCSEYGAFNIRRLNVEWERHQILDSELVT